MATKEMSIKLMIDPESNRLIFAEASKDFVDFLIYILSLPIATVKTLLLGEFNVGSVGNIYSSVSNLDEASLGDYVKFDILYPSVSPYAINTPLSRIGTSTNTPYQFYTCIDPKCKGGITNLHCGVHCPGCDQYMSNEIEFIDNKEGYVQSAVPYMISDDLSITPISTLSIVSMLNKFNVTKPEEKVVKIGKQEALELLKASLRSTTVLTDVFLNRKTRKHPGNEQQRMNIRVNTQSGHTINFVVLPTSKTHKIMFKIEEIMGICPKSQALIFGGRRLSGERTFADYNIEDGSVIDLILHQTGC